MNYYIKPRDSDLMHYGVLGMHWGIRRYQPYSVKPRGSGKTGKEIRSAAKLANDAGKKLTRKQKKNLAEKEQRKKEIVEKRNQEEFERQRFEADKKRLLSEGSATEIYNNRRFLTDAELANAVSRLTSANQLRNMSEKEFQSSLQKIDKIMKNAGTVASWGDTGIKLYNQIAGIYNATEEGSKKPMRHISTGSGEGKGKRNK